MSKIIALIYGIVSYLCFFVSFVYLFGFTGDVFVPKSVSFGGETGGLFAAFVINLGFIALFGIQHSIMARPAFKKWWTQYVPAHLERSTFVLITSVILFLTYLYWRPLPKEIWNVQGTLLEPVLWFLFAGGMLVVLLSSFMINHFDLFGLRQVFLYARGKEYSNVPFAVKGFYKLVRNPLMLGFLISFWAAPVMTLGRLLFAGGMTVYIFIGIYFEERTIAAHLGEEYKRYQRNTSMILPMQVKRT